MKKLARLLAASFALTALSASALTPKEEILATPEKAGGVYYAYPGPQGALTPAPKGYTPFYISHYGRHGSRYLISDRDYRFLIDPLEKADSANALTPKGRELLRSLGPVWEEARGRGGELTPLGRRQHHDIAARMYANYPEALQGDASVTAASTPVMRCAHSMFAFIEGLKEQNPSLDIPRESSQRNMYYLNHHTPESGKYTRNDSEASHEIRRFTEEMVRPDRIIGEIFSDSLFVRRNIDPDNFMTSLYWTAVDLQNMETDLDILDLFTPEELADLWQLYNFSFFAHNSSYAPAQGLHVANAKNLLRNIIDTADEYIGQGRRGATLRFGHDGNIIPLTALLQLPGCSSNQTNPYRLADTYANFRISPMASNLQLVFFRDKKGDVIVKALLNERETALPAPTDIYPYYRWTDLRPVLDAIAR